MTTLAPVRWIGLALLVAVLAGCGSSSKAVGTTTTTAVIPKPGPGKVLYQGGAWAVVVSGGAARALRLSGGSWQPASGGVKISILAPHGTAAPTPQVAAELSAKAPIVESGLWVDGTELSEKGGGLTPNRVTIYGAPAAPLAAGKHLAVAYGRTAGHATAVAWTFRVG